MKFEEWVSVVVGSFFLCSLVVYLLFMYGGF